MCIDPARSSYLIPGREGRHCNHIFQGSLYTCTRDPTQPLGKLNSITRPHPPHAAQTQCFNRAWRQFRTSQRTSGCARVQGSPRKMRSATWPQAKTVTVKVHMLGFESGI